MNKQIYRLISLFLTLFLTVGIIPVSATAATTTGTCGANLSWQFEGNTLIISGNGPMDNYPFAMDGDPWHKAGIARQIKKVIIEDGVTSVGSSAFFSSNVNEIYFGSTVTTLGSNAFQGSNLVTLSLPGSVTLMGENVFAFCSKLKSVVMEEGIPYLCDRMFWDCGNLTTVTIPNSVTNIGMWAFMDCGSLTNVTIPKNVNYIGAFAFANCIDMSRVVFTGDAPRIVSNAFSGVTADVYYPADKDWTEDALLNYGGNLTWVPYTGDVPVNYPTAGTYTTDLIMPAADLGVSAPDSVLRATLTFTEDGKASATWEAVNLTAFRLFFRDMFVSSYYAMAYGAGITDINEIESFCMESTGMSVTAYMDTIVTEKAINDAFTPASSTGTYSYNDTYTAIFTDLAIMGVSSNPTVENSFALSDGTLHLNAASWGKPDYTFVCTAK